MGNDGYYRNQIEKLLQFGVMFKDSSGRFRPNENIDKRAFISALCALWGLDTSKEDIKSALSPYNSKGYMTREEMAAVILTAYKLKFGYDEKMSLNRPPYMTDYNGTTISPDDPNYDPNLKGEETGYYPIITWEELNDKEEISPQYADAFHIVYDLGLMRSEEGIESGKVKNGTLLKPKEKVTRAKAAKELWFLWVLAHDILEDDSSLIIKTT
ncbi:MAG: S-layer homology domain-containing protein [Clostridiales bacterium]|nr:S-layer homology domain-containing protein [Clostridiales bacterium]